MDRYIARQIMYRYRSIYFFQVIGNNAALSEDSASKHRKMDVPNLLSGKHPLFRNMWVIDCTFCPNATGHPRSSLAKHRWHPAAAHGTWWDAHCWTRKLPGCVESKQGARMWHMGDSVTVSAVIVALPCSFHLRNSTQDADSCPGWDVCCQSRLPIPPGSAGLGA